MGYPPVLDCCCGSRMFWFDRNDDRAMFMDIRNETFECKNGHTIEINPDVVGDFRNVPFPDETFHLVVFDPPHHTSRRLGSCDTSTIAREYGRLFEDWRVTIAAGFSECFRVLVPNGVLVFKWGSVEISLNTILELAMHRPLFGHRTKANTHWVVFIKPDE